MAEPRRRGSRGRGGDGGTGAGDGAGGGAAVPAGMTGPGMPDPTVGEGGGGAPERPEVRDRSGRVSVLVELLSGPGVSPVLATAGVRGVEAGGFTLDEEFQPVPLGAGGPALRGFAAGAGSETYVVRATVDDEAAMAQILERPDVVNVWRDTPIAPFGPCPIAPCDCSPGTPRGTMADVATYLGVSELWTAGFRGAGMVVGVVDGGITAQGRPVKTGETSRRIPRVIGGWPVADWGTEASAWKEHGNMCSTDVLGMAPEAQIYDLRISGGADIPATISRALQAFQWAIDQHRANGTPQVLSNSWGIFQESWDNTYARNPNHPFTRKVLEALDEGILVLFAAGNCGGACPDGRCGPDNGPGRSIWGANSHTRVMTVGAVNKNEEFVGYSSQGPGALDPNKPDFCSVTHFTGYHNSDSGTSAATPILAGAVALLKQAVPAATQDGIKNALKNTAKDIGPSGFDQHSGTGIVRVKAAWDSLRGGALPISKLVCQPSVTVLCQSKAAACNVSKIICGPASQVTICEPSKVKICIPVTHVAVCQQIPTRPPGCGIVPVTRVCPSVACGPPRPEPGLAPEVPEGWIAVDPAWIEWYGGEGDPGAEFETWTDT
ncbi:MAG: S8 family peptidase [Acidimicrobiia bacterium]